MNDMSLSIRPHRAAGLSAANVTPTCSLCQQVGLSVRLCERHAYVPDLIKAARHLLDEGDHQDEGPAIAAETLRRILARIDGDRGTEK